MYYRNLLHVSEVVQAIISSIESNRITGFQAINLGSNNSLTVYDICMHLIKKLKDKIMNKEKYASTKKKRLRKKKKKKI